MSFLTPVRCYTCRKVILVNKFLRAVEKQREESKDKNVDYNVNYEKIFNEVFEGKLLPCCKPRYMNILSNIQKEKILVAYDTT